MTLRTFPSGRTVGRLTFAAGAALALAACSRGGEQPKVPLNQVTQQAQPTNPHDALPADARTAIDSGNAEYRAGRFASALEQYRLAAKAAPNNAAPYFGIYMVAKKQNNAKLADSAMAQIKDKATGAAKMLTDSSMGTLHTTGASAAGAVANPHQ